MPPETKSLFRALPELESQRLVLRKVNLDDVQDLFDYASDPQVTRHVLWETHTSLLDSHTYLKNMCRKYMAGAVTEWGIEMKSMRRLIGTCGFVGYEPDHFRAEVGYALGRAYWGKGIATEALNTVAWHAFYTLGLLRLEARTTVDNVASQSVLRHLGFRQEGLLRNHLHLKGHLQDIQVWGLLREEAILNDLTMV